MAEYIAKEAALNLCGWYNTVNGKSICAARKDELAALPAADVVEVNHGRWEYKVETVGSHEEGWFACSLCGYEFWDMENFCPNCGAKMDGERRDDHDD